MKYDVIVIGAGPGGYTAALRAAKLGMSTAVVESSNLGGICLNWGCIPTKALLKSAQALHYAQSGAEFGFGAECVTADLQAMVARSRKVAEMMNAGIAYLFKKYGVTHIPGMGKVLDGLRVEVTPAEGEKSIYEAGSIILATGSQPVSLPMAPIDGEKIGCYYQALMPEALPSSLAVIGSGAIGSEFAFFYRSLGVDVTIIEYMDRILPLEDDEVSAQMSRSFRKAGIKVMTSSAVKSVDTNGDKCVITVGTAKGDVTLEAEKVLSAAGVRPNTEGIGLEELGVALDKKGKVIVDGQYRTNVKGIYAIGDIIPTQALAHVAEAEAIRCVEGIAGLSPAPVNYDNIPACTYTSPEVASVGMTERAVKAAGIEYKVGKFPFTASGKATAAGERDGFVKIIADAASDRILGVHIVGANASEMIGGMVVARNLGATATDAARSVFPHPTMSEAVMEAAAALHGESVQI